MARPREFVRYVCSVCYSTRTSHVVLKVCPSCVWQSLFFLTTEGDDFREEPVRCEADGCNAATRYRKPYCSDHVELMPHVIWLRGQLNS